MQFSPSTSLFDFSLHCCQSGDLRNPHWLSFAGGITAAAAAASAMTIYGPWLACLSRTRSQLQFMTDFFWFTAPSVRWCAERQKKEKKEPSIEILQKTINCTLYCVSIFHNHGESNAICEGIIRTGIFSNSNHKRGLMDEKLRHVGVSFTEYYIHLISLYSILA